MRIVIDMQGAQTESRFRGIGRYTMSLAQAVVRNRGEHEIILALSGLFPNTIEPIRAAFDGLLPQENIRVWYAPGPVREEDSGNESRREVAELIREAFLASLRPDVIHISSLFEGYVDDAVTSIGRFETQTPVTVTVFELPEHPDRASHRYGLWLHSKTEALSQSAAYFVTAEVESLDIVSGKRLVTIPIASTNDWDAVAYQAFEQWASAVRATREVPPQKRTVKRRPRLAYVSPLPPERTGIADYSVELLQALDEYYEIDVVVAQDRVNTPWINQHAQVRDVAWLKAHAKEVDHVLYHFGNSPFHAHMLSLIQDIPGVVVLHDLFLSDLLRWIGKPIAEGSLIHELYSNHGYPAVFRRSESPETKVCKYPCSFSVVRNAQGVIVHSEYSRQLARQYYGNEMPSDWAVIPLLRAPAAPSNRREARKRLGIGLDDYVICCFGFMGPTKLNHRILECWFASSLSRDERCHLIFVGENHGSDYGVDMLRAIKRSGLTNRIRITGFAPPELYRQYLMAADLAVQLRTQSRGETSAAVLDCMNYALPVIVNSNGSMAELDHDVVWMLPDGFEDNELINALETLWREPERRRTLGERARAVILERHAPAACAQRYAEAIERFYHSSKTTTPALINAIAKHCDGSFDDSDLLRLSKAIAATMPLARPAKSLFLDVTATCHTDLKTGIERVARALTLALLEDPPQGYRVEPVYLDNVDGEWFYRYARRYTLGLLDCLPETLADEVVEPESGDILLGLDLSGGMLKQAQMAGLFAAYRNNGVAVYFMVHDILPIRLPEFFPPRADEAHKQWLEAVLTFDGAICVSKAVAEDLASWHKDIGLNMAKRRPYLIGWSHHGADVFNSAPSRGLPDNAEATLAQLKIRPSFLMVGTIEPRKGYLQTIEAFTQLWDQGVNVNLVIVGKEGWKGLSDNMRRDIPETVQRLRAHPELNKRLFWLNGISDEYLGKVYAASTCLIAASYGEGFGLPLIEAAQHKMPIIARDIPVFREVAGQAASYFAGNEPICIKDAIIRWLGLSGNELGQEGTVSSLTWAESAHNLLGLLLHQHADNIGLHFGLLEQDVCSFDRLFVDISVVCRNDYRTGIQRVVRALLAELINNPPKKYQVIPVYLSEIDGRWAYYIAEQWLHGYHNEEMRTNNSSLSREMHAGVGDILLGLDLAGGYVVAASQQGLYKKLEALGVKTYFTVYDLLPVVTPNFFNASDTEGHIKWLTSISECHGVICISESVEKEFVAWHKTYIGNLPKEFVVMHFHLGADIENSMPSLGLPIDQETTLITLNKRLTFLSVGTIEPRKGHCQVLDAFEELWKTGENVNWVIVGKQGWMMDGFAKRLRSHPELNKRLFWLDSISDEYLEKVYAASTCLIAASYGEGFGLPLIEAAKHKLPIIARDIPVFREVAGEFAYCFDGKKPHQLAESIKKWISLYKKDRHPRSDDMPWLTWKESAIQLIDAVVSGGWPCRQVCDKTQKKAIDEHLNYIPCSSHDPK